MLLRNLLDFMFASPVMAVTSLVSAACASILVVNISSNMSISNEVVRSSSQETLSNKYQNSVEHSNLLETDEQAGEYSSNKLNAGFKSNGLSSDRKSAKSTNDSNIRDQLYVDDNRGLPTNSDSPSFNNKTPSIFNYSSIGNSSSVNTTSTSATNTSTSSTITIESDTTPNINDPDVIPDINNIENEFPASLDNTVKIDLDETQTISCRPVVANGPPCMCTFTTSDASGSVSEVVDNCS